MPRKGDREILVDPPPKLDLDGVAKSSSIPETLTSSNLKTFRSFRDWLCGDLSSTSNQLQIIYISIAACLAAISFALLLAIFFGPQQVTPHGFFVSDFSSCSRLGKELMVSKGGNAVDALISIVLCLSVTRQDIISLGGCGAFWVHQRDTGSNSLFDAMCSSPNSIENDLQNSAQTVSVPGLVAGLKSLHDKYGYLYWSNLFHSAIVRAEEGFSVHPDLRANLEKVAADNSHPASQFANNQLSALVNKTWGPQFELEETLKTLAADGAMPFYNGSIGDSIVSALSPHNVTWEIKKDLGAYQVLNPQHITLGLAGFNVRGFPAPFVGGTLTTSVLANLDLLNHQRPLNARKLAQNDAEELSVLYHRLIELNKLGSSQISTLGDPYTSVEGKSVADLEKNLLSLDARKKIVELVKDDRVLTTSECGEPDPLLFVTPETNTFVLTVESDMLIASAVLTLGGTAFGSGIVTPKTGILLNSAQLFFSSSSINKGANFAAPGRRPLLPTSPVFFETTQQQCGHRFLAASSGGNSRDDGYFSGESLLIIGYDPNQVLTSSFLYLSNVSCKGGGDGQSSDKTVSKELPSVSETTVTYNPAVGACLPLNDSLALKRFSLQLSGQEFSVHLEPGFNRAIGEKLKKIGHNVVFDSKDERRPRVAAVGWTLYTTIGGVEEKDRDDSAWF